MEVPEMPKSVKSYFEKLAANKELVPNVSMDEIDAAHEASHDLIAAASEAAEAPTGATGVTGGFGEETFRFVSDGPTAEHSKMGNRFRFKEARQMQNGHVDAWRPRLASSALELLQTRQPSARPLAVAALSLLESGSVMKKVPDTLDPPPAQLVLGTEAAAAAARRNYELLDHVGQSLFDEVEEADHTMVSSHRSLLLGLNKVLEKVDIFTESRYEAGKKDFARVRHSVDIAKADDAAVGAAAQRAYELQGQLDWLKDTLHKAQLWRGAEEKGEGNAQLLSALEALGEVRE